MTTARSQPRLVVGVGASAGGLEAFKTLMDALPVDTGMAFLLVQHLDPAHKSLLAELLAPSTAMLVRDADHGITLEANTVYIIRPDTSLAVQDGKIVLSEPTLHRGVRLPVDHLFRSLAREYGARSVGIILSGAGSDGSGGIREIKAAGGLTIAQQPEESGQSGMPRSALDTGVIDLVLDISEIPAALARFEDLPPQARVNEAVERADRAPLASLGKQDISRLAALLEAQADFDLRVYKPATIERRVLRRMALAGFDDNVALYFEHLRSAPAEQQSLLRDLLISVTEFFRDPEAFEALRRLVIEPLVSEAAAGETLRAWVPGCATGEEAYSIAIELIDAIAAAGKRLAVQIFATDIDQDALAFAREGVYPPSIADHVSEHRLRSHFTQLDGKGYQVRPPLRDVVSFAAHDLTRDPPFSRMHLVSCRNVLIYLTSEAQKHVLKTLHFALQPAGHLLLSTSESTGPQRELFATISKRQRLYRKVGRSRPIAVARSRPTAALAAAASDQGGEAPARRASARSDLARRAALDAFAPPMLIVAEDGTVLFCHGDIMPWVQMPMGENPRFEINAVLRPAIATRARRALYRCRRDNNNVSVVSSPGGLQDRVKIEARPAPALGDGAVILAFEHLDEGEARAGADTTAGQPESPEHEAVVEQLENELRATREDLRNTVEELETSNEELRSSNEESMSMNEELQSANEELEATTEELRSLNEELTTVNTQLREKIEQLELAHDDLNNFFASTKIATIFLDAGLRIKRFSPAARPLLGIDHADVGRSVGDLARELLQNELEAEGKAVLEHLSPRTREIRTRDGRWVSRRVLPYRTQSRRIEGVVVTFTDVTDLRTWNQELATKTRRLELAWEAARGGVLEHRIPVDASTYLSDQWAQVLGYRPEDLPSDERLLSWVFAQAHPDDREQFEQTYNELVEGATDRYVVELRFRHHAGHWIWARAIAKVLERDDQGRPRHLLRMLIDITDLKEFEASLRESEVRFREMADGLPLMVWVHDDAGEQVMVNERFCEFFGVSRDEMKGKRWQMLVHPEDAEAYAREFYACTADKRPFHHEARVRRADGAWRWLESWGRPRLSPDGRFHGFVGTSADVTERRAMEAHLRESEQRFRAIVEASSEVLYRMSPDWREMRQLHGHGFLANTEQSSTDWLSDYIPAEEQPRVRAVFEQAIRDRSVFELEHRVVRADGTLGWTLSRAVPLLDDAGAIVEWFGAASDITERKRAEQELRQQHARKDEFLAMLGHELRNPLAAIRSASEHLKLTADDPRLERTQAILDRQSAQMAKLLDGLLDVSRIMRGKIDIEPRTIDLAALCREVASDAGARLASRDLTLRADISEQPVWVEADPVRVTQILDNLLSNAIRYTPDGGQISLALAREDEHATLEVRDTGVGIEPELLPHIFEPFRQSTQHLDRADGGLGLGLALVKSLVEIHGGRVEARSGGQNKGTEFIARFPLTDKTPSTAGDGSEDVGPLRILLIEDNKDTAAMLKIVLEMSGHQVTLATHADQGIELAREGEPDVVLCDIGLPDGMSGFDVAEALRADASTRALPLVALSGYGRPEDKARCEEVGFDAHLTKPVDAASICRVLEEVRENKLNE